MKGVDYSWCERITNNVLNLEKREIEEQLEYVSNFEMFKMICGSTLAGMALFVIIWMIETL